MTEGSVEGPVNVERQVPRGTRVQIDIPVRSFLMVNGLMFGCSAYSIYHTLKALIKLQREV